MKFLSNLNHVHLVYPPWDQMLHSSASVHFRFHTFHAGWSLLYIKHHLSVIDFGRGDKWSSDLYPRPFFGGSSTHLSFAVESPDEFQTPVQFCKNQLPACSIKHFRATDIWKTLEAKASLDMDSPFSFLQTCHSWVSAIRKQASTIAVNFVY